MHNLASHTPCVHTNNSLSLTINSIVLKDRQSQSPHKTIVIKCAFVCSSIIGCIGSYLPQHQHSLFFMDYHVLIN